MGVGLSVQNAIGSASNRHPTSSMHANIEIISDVMNYLWPLTEETGFCGGSRRGGKLLPDMPHILCSTLPYEVVFRIVSICDNASLVNFVLSSWKEKQYLWLKDRAGVNKLCKDFNSIPHVTQGKIWILVRPPTAIPAQTIKSQQHLIHTNPWCCWPKIPSFRGPPNQ